MITGRLITVLAGLGIVIIFIVLSRNPRRSFGDELKEFSNTILSVFQYIGRLHLEIPFVRFLFHDDKKLQNLHRTYRKTYKKYKNGQSIREIAKERDLNQSTIRKHIRKLKEEKII